MALHTDLPIYKTGCDLLSLAIRAQEQMPRGIKRNLGDKVISHCTEMLDLMAMANVTQRRTVATALHRIEQADAADVFALGNSYLGLVRQAQHSHHHQARIAKALLKRGHSVAGDLSKIYRSSAS